MGRDSSGTQSIATASGLKAECTQALRDSGLLWASVSQSIVEMLHTDALFVVLISVEKSSWMSAGLKWHKSEEVLRLVKDALGRRRSKEPQPKKKIPKSGSFQHMFFFFHGK